MTSARPGCIIVNMASISNIALSGMRAAQTQLGVSAHNVANVATEGFKRQTVVQTEQPDGGVSAAVTRSSVEGPSLEADVVSQLQETTGTGQGFA